MNNIMKSEFFLEIMCEKIPASAQLNNTFHEEVQAIISAHKYMDDVTVKTMISANRLVCIINNFPNILQKEALTIKGPKKSTDPEIVSKFLEKHSATEEDLIVPERSEEYLYLKLTQKIQSLEENVDKFILSIIDNIVWPEYMRWLPGTRFVRPIRRVIATYDGSPLSFKLDTLNLCSSGTSLYYIYQSEEFLFSSAENYLKILEQNYVYVGHEARKKYAYNQINALLQNTDLNLELDSHNMIADILLCSESPIIYLVQPKQTLALPDDIKKIVMMYHQKFVPLFEGGRLASAFLVHANSKLHDEGERLKIDAERALNARMLEAERFWLHDLSIDKEQYTEMTKKSNLNKDLGSLYMQTQRLERAIKELCNGDEHLLSAISFLNLDLCMQTVFEVPEFHGIMSGLYAMHKYNSPKEVFKILSDTIYPYPEAPVPDKINISGALLGFIVRIDELTGFIGKGVIPKGSSDQFGLRRIAMALVKLGFFLNAKLGTTFPNIAHIIRCIIQSYHDQGISIAESCLQDTIEFIRRRMENYLQVQSAELGSIFIHNAITWQEENQLKEILQNHELYLNLKVFYKRLVGICAPSEIPISKTEIPEHKSILEVLGELVLDKYGLLDLQNLATATEVLLTKVRIQDLEKDTQLVIYATLNKIKALFDRYCNFN